ncbi:hypothetical protein [Sphingomonas sp.]|uniref:hypothetical protein n=1 Tax=Sphingomonas sp. TaxID=28214 RepID=UPI003B00B7B6
MAEEIVSPGHEPDAKGDDRPDIVQAVEARADAVARGEGGPEPDPMLKTGDYSGNAGTGGEVKNQDVDAQ